MEVEVEDAQELVSLVSSVMLKKLKKKGKKRVWVRPWIARRESLGLSTTLIHELEKEDKRAFTQLLRISPEKYNELLRVVAPKIQRRDTHLRKAIPAKTKLDVALRYLATGNSFTDMQYAFRVPEGSISKFMPETLEAIGDALKEYLQMPQTEQEWAEIQNVYEERWNFPGCAGSIDGKHVKIQCPPKSGSTFFNYKEYFSVILMAVVDGNYCFTFIEYGTNGRANDSAAFRESSFYAGLINQSLHLPEAYVFAADDAFAMKHKVLKPFARCKVLNMMEKVFNYRLSRARRTVENAFGILACRFRIFLTPIQVSLSTVDNIIRATVSLHNWLRRTSPTYYTPLLSFDEEDPITGEVSPGLWRTEIEFPAATSKFGSNNYSEESALLRNAFAEWFMNEGAVPWQWQAAQCL